MTDPDATDREAGGRGEGATRAGSEPEDGLAVVRLLLLAAVLRIVAAVLFEIAVYGVQNLLWSNLPDAVKPRQ